MVVFVVCSSILFGLQVILTKCSSILFGLQVILMKQLVKGNNCYQVEAKKDLLFSMATLIQNSIESSKEKLTLTQLKYEDSTAYKNQEKISGNHFSPVMVKRNRK